MITLYTSSTPNGWKASVCLEELGLDYEVHSVSLSKNQQKEPWFLEINPNGRIPAIVDHDGPNGEDHAVFESGAILLYLAEKTGQLLPQDAAGRSRTVQWLMFQMGGLGPMMGQANVFYRYFPEKIPSAIERYQRESRRLLEVLDVQLGRTPYLAGDAYTIADIANWCWACTHSWSGVSVEGLDHLSRWMGDVRARPAVERGRSVPERIRLSKDDEKEFVKNARKMLA